MADAKEQATGLCDIHCHILPGIDDGADSLETSLAMCRLAVADGIRTIVATPHFNDRFQPDDATVDAALELLRAAAAREGLPLEILPGADVAPHMRLKELTANGRLTIARQGKYMLLEPPRQSMPDWLDEVIFDVRVNGIGVILTHPERNLEVQRNPNTIVRLVQSGVMVQITADSIVGTFGPEAERCAISLLKMNAAHFIATDAHSADHRAPCIWDALQKASKYAGDYAMTMACENPRAVVNGELITVPEPQPLRSWFGGIINSA